MNSRLRDLAGECGGLSRIMQDDFAQLKKRWQDAQAVTFSREHIGPISETLRELTLALEQCEVAMVQFGKVERR